MAPSCKNKGGNDTAKTPFTERRTTVEQASGNDEADCRKYLPGNKAAT
ncbi:hypothetical protein COLO4_14810 [Corchorus olitorius]|uniref:Uncharacterized protein n=1 Tax=Corchorus olitorius TaxID=93759 RepID=A0A1R3JQT2_9ROSI|nr:hypothetical protein COLO4_14810 [Corchorus olitorius]